MHVSYAYIYMYKDYIETLQCQEGECVISLIKGIWTVIRNTKQNKTSRLLQGQITVRVCYKNKKNPHQFLC